MNITVVTPTSFSKWIREARMTHLYPAILMVQMPGCRPCKKLYPEFELMAKQHPSLAFATYVIDPSDISHKGFVQKLRVKATPTFLAYDWNEQQLFTGQSSAGLLQLTEFIDTYKFD